MYNRGDGRGRGRGYVPQTLEMWENHPGKPSMKSRIKPDPLTGCYKLHVRSIPRSWTEITLKNVFRRVGVPTSVYLNNGGDFPLAWGFVEYETFEEAAEAVKTLNNNQYLDYIEVSFAREKVTDDDSFLNYLDDNTFEPLNQQSTPIAHHRQTPRIENTFSSAAGNDTSNIKMYSKTIKNENALGTNLPLGKWIKAPGQSEEKAYLENAIFNRVLAIYKDLKASANCEVCNKDTNKKCEDCAIHYCSILCQAKHWPSHSKTCIRLDDKSISKMDLRGGGDARPRNKELTNGFGSDQFNRNSRSRENLHNDNRFEEKQRYDNRRNNDKDRPSRFGNKQNSRFNDTQNNREHTRDRSRHDNDRLGNRQNNRNDGGGQKSMFEERKSKYFSDKPNKSETESEDLWDVTEKKTQNDVQNHSTSSTIGSPACQIPEVGTSVETVTNLSSKGIQIPEVGKSVETVTNLSSKGIQVSKTGKAIETATDPSSGDKEVHELGTSTSFDLKPGVIKEVSKTGKAIETATDPSSGDTEVHELGTSTSFDLKPGVIKEVLISTIESPGIFNVQLLDGGFSTFSDELNSTNAVFAPFTPVENGICVSLYEDVWCRCKVTSMNPLTVLYIDYGNSETLTADKLFTLPKNFASKPPFAIKVKLAPGTPGEFFNKVQYSQLSVKTINKVNDYWEVEVAGAVYPHMTSECPSESNSSISQDRQETAQTTAPVFSKLLPADVFTEVCIKHVDSEYLAVIPVAKLPELKLFSAQLQIEAEMAAPITPALTKCLALCPEKNQWCRGRIVHLEPLHVKFVDFGMTQACNPANLREISSDLTSVAPFVVCIKPKNASLEELCEKTTFSVKPLYKEKSGCWVVEVASSVHMEQAESTCSTSETPIKASTSSRTSQPSITKQQPEAKYPDILNSEGFSSVLIMLLENNISSDGDTYFVAKPTFWDSLVKIASQLKNVPKSILVSPQIGDIGLAFYQDYWYRVKVVSLSPLRVFYMDYGNTEILSNPEELFICPDSYKNLSPLVCKVKLASGTNKKYFNLPLESDFSIKPISVISDGTILVQVEGEVYSEPVHPVQTENEQSTEMPTRAQVNPQSPIPIDSVQSQHPAVRPNVEKEITEPHNTVDLLEEGYEVNFLSNKMDLAREILLGTVFTKNIPETKKLAIDDEYENVFNMEPYDPNFTPRVGEMVLCMYNDEWQRARVLEVKGDRWFSLVDYGMIVRCVKCKRLPQQFSSAPSLAAVLKLITPIDIEQLKKLQDEVEMQFKVVKIASGKRLLQGNVTDMDLRAELKKWSYEPLAYPLPLASGALVTISKMVKSNVVAVIPADDHATDQQIQIECDKVICKEFQVPPKIGDYVVVKGEDCVYHRARVESIDSKKNEYTLRDIDLWHKTTVALASIQPMPASLYNLPCRATPVFLKGVRMIELDVMTELAKIYIANLVEEDMTLRIEYDENDPYSLVSLTTVGKEEQVVNEKLEEYLTPKIVPDLNGKFMLHSLIFDNPPLNEELTLVVTHSDALYVQTNQSCKRYYEEVHVNIAKYAESESALYNPCQNEVCIVKYDGEWYRAVCLQERNTGVNSVLLLDFGNILDMPTSNIRKMQKQFLAVPIIGIACKVIGLPDNVSPKLRHRLNEILYENSLHKGIFEYKKEGSYYVSLPSVLTMLKVEDLLP